MKPAERFGRLLLARKNFHALFGERRAHFRNGQCLDDYGIEPANDVLRRGNVLKQEATDVLWAPHASSPRRRFVRIRFQPSND